MGFGDKADFDSRGRWREVLRARDVGDHDAALAALERFGETVRNVERRLGGVGRAALWGACTLSIQTLGWLKADILFDTGRLDECLALYAAAENGLNDLEVAFAKARVLLVKGEEDRALELIVEGAGCWHERHRIRECDIADGDESYGLFEQNWLQLMVGSGTDPDYEFTAPARQVCATLLGSERLLRALGSEETRAEAWVRSLHEELSEERRRLRGIPQSADEVPIERIRKAFAKAEAAFVEQSRRVLRIEAERKERGYKPGWTYYRCKEAGLVEAYERLKRKANERATRGRGARPPGRRLTVELVPSSCWFSNVRSEVSEADWAMLKKETFGKAGYRCEVCGGRGSKWPVECHEVWHYDDDNKVQKLQGLIGLCPACHEVKHIGLAGLRGRERAAMQHLASVNGWTAEETERYLEQQFDLWEIRSRHGWTLDLAWLKDRDVTVVRGPE